LALKVAALDGLTHAMLLRNAATIGDAIKQSIMVATAILPRKIMI
jgi:hypothetical protein